MTGRGGGTGGEKTGRDRPDADQFDSGQNPVRDGVKAS